MTSIEALNGAVTQIGYAHVINYLVNDLNGNLIKIKGTISIPQIGDVAANDKPVYWTLGGKCLGISNNDYDLIHLTPYVAPTS